MTVEEVIDTNLLYRLNNFFKKESFLRNLGLQNYVRMHIYSSGIMCIKFHLDDLITDRKI